MSAANPTAPRATSPRPTSPRTAGAYLQLRRRHAGLTRRRVADLMNETPASSDATLQQLAHFEETGEMLPGFPMTLSRLGSLLGIDRAALEFLMLGIPGPPICRACGCTYNTPCMTVIGRPCSWAEENLCTACAPALTKKEKAHA